MSVPLKTWVVVALVVLALFLGFRSYRQVAVRVGPSGAAAPAPEASAAVDMPTAPAAAPTAVPAAAPVTASATVAAAVANAQPVDVAAGWVLSPRRDPFAPVPVPVPAPVVAVVPAEPAAPAPTPAPVQVEAPKPKPPAAAEVLKIQALYVQPGKRLAVVNGAVVKEGGRLGPFGAGATAAGPYTVEKIEANGLWLNGPLGREFVGR
ncbi:MAG: hypothetical protein A3K19_23210 [Lentisphaerae bacterium RIFOXYB12_FULL_65_16]|nr:MAG: hypothetical protein A3K18_30820 [Lentisphaerae bacterium RIFOXYA12_64_32]OGV90278.1 MAG: hypothetical protein A3K19_23210 [Lentisphaerae bacterium RIFOXYB12_FULL_65_16]